MVVLRNTVIWTARPIYSASAGTSVPSSYLSAIDAHTGPVPSSDFHVLPDAALTSDYLVKVDAGTDIKTGDVITQVCLPDLTHSPWDGLSVSEELWVTFDRLSAAGPLAHLRLYCKRVTAGGPV
jgi:hypothetical protein